MNQDSDSDYEQVFIINETEDSPVSQQPRGTASILSDVDYDVDYQQNSRDIEVVKTSIGGFLVFVSVFVGILLFFTFVAPHIKLNSDYVGKASFALFLLWLLYMLISPSSKSDMYLIAKSKKNTASNSSSRQGRKNKINTIQGHTAHQASVENQRISNLTESQRLEKQKAENIELAVRALVSLKFKINRANDLVSRALDSGIPPEDTQMLIRYALTNNNRA
jgi:hypothetical protein